MQERLLQAFEKDRPKNIDSNNYPIGRMQVFQIVRLCNKYQQIGPEGETPVNRKILLDENIADQISEQSIKIIFAMNPDDDFLLKRFVEGHEKNITIAEVFCDALKDIEALQLLSNQENWQPEQADKMRKDAFINNTLPIIIKILNLFNEKEKAKVKVTEQDKKDSIFDSKSHNSSSLLQRFNKITETIDIISKKNNADKLLQHEETPLTLRRQSCYGFKVLVDELLKIENKNGSVRYDKDIQITGYSMEDFCSAVIKYTHLLFHNEVSQFFLNRVYLEAIIEQDNKIIFNDGEEYSLRDVLRKLIEKSDKSPTAIEQFHIRLKQIEKDLEARANSLLEDSPIPPTLFHALTDFLVQNAKPLLGLNVALLLAVIAIGVSTGLGFFGAASYGVFIGATAVEAFASVCCGISLYSLFKQEPVNHEDPNFQLRATKI